MCVGGLAVWLLAVTAGWCAAAASAAATEPIRLVPVAEGIYVYAGPHAEASDRNLGAVGNLGVVVGPEAVALIDTGGSHGFGRLLRKAVGEVTDLPVRYVINTHMHPDHVLGNAAFAGDEVEIVGHRRLGAALGARATHYLEAGRRDIGPSFAGTRIVSPTLTVTDVLHLDLGGRILDVKAHGTAHTDNDLTILDRQTGTLFAGDLVFVDRLPVVDGSLKGWLGVMEQLRSIEAVRVVPGHGPVSVAWPDALAGQERYLRALLRDVRSEIESGGTIKHAIGWVAAEEKGKWERFDEDHPRNVTASFAELEWE